jgi:hypothetical protein
MTGRFVIREGTEANAMSELDRLLFLQGHIACRLQPKGRINRLSDVEFSVSSQFGEDGIIEWLVDKLDPKSTKFIEFGVENFHESNCRFVMQNRNWKGFVIDSSKERIAELAKRQYYWMHHLVSTAAFVTSENINYLIEASGFSGQIGILSIDIDGNDYWVWDAINVCQPDIVIVEYNSFLGDRYAVTIPYQPDFNRFAAHPSGRYCGASLPALQQVAETKGCTLVGSNSAGTNAFFVRNALAWPVLDTIADRRALPTRMRHSRTRDGGFAFHRHARDVAALLSRLPVVDVVTGETTTFGDLAEPYSEEWLQHL